MTNRTSRLAPSPTGALHLGNMRTFLINWALARQGGWKLCMRIEDLDGPRNKPDAGGQALDILNWLGIDHDGDVLHQSDDLDPYRCAMRSLASLKLIYSCRLTRGEILAATSAPVVEPGGTIISREVRYEPELRPSEADAYAFHHEDTNYRLLVPEELIDIDDAVMGPQVQCPSREIGDFVIWTRTGMPAYQLAVVVDDARQGVTDVVRGADLLSSAARQTLLYRALNLPVPRWWHLPLVLGPDGRKLAKRHGDSRIDSYRSAGASPQRIIGLLASWSGWPGEPAEMSIENFRDGFQLDRLPREPVVFNEEHHRWLLGG